MKGLNCAKYDFQHEVQRYELGGFIFLPVKRRLETSMMRGWYYSNYEGECPRELQMGELQNRGQHYRTIRDRLLESLNKLGLRAKESFGIHAVELEWPE